MACLGGLLRGRGDERASYCYILRPGMLPHCVRGRLSLNSAKRIFKTDVTNVV
jgi:hypothetical protein